MPDPLHLGPWTIHPLTSGTFGLDGGDGGKAHSVITRKMRVGDMACRMIKFFITS